MGSSKEHVNDVNMIFFNQVVQIFYRAECSKQFFQREGWIGGQDGDAVFSKKFFSRFVFRCFKNCFPNHELPDVAAVRKK